MPETMKPVNGKLRKIILTPIMARNIDLRWRQNHRKTIKIDTITRNESVVSNSRIWSKTMIKVIN